MKTAKIVSAARELLCPGCWRALPEPREGSYVWTERAPDGITTAKCEECGTVARLPRVFTGLPL